LIDHEGKMLGLVPTDQAMQMAREVGMDVVEVSPNERPPVCKIMDYGKHKYVQSKKQKQKHHERKTKEVRLRPKTDPHDRQIKLARSKSFLEHGDRVQFTMMFRGRERFHAEAGYEAFNDILAALGDAAKIEQPPRLQGRRLTMVIAPAKAPRLIKPDRPEPAARSKNPAKEAGEAAASGDELAPGPEEAETEPSSV
jgi:translation initiation factor IF-3